MRRVLLSFAVTGMMALAAATASLAAEAAEAEKAAKPEAAVTADAATPAQLRAELHRTMAALIEEQAAPQPDSAKIDKLTAQLQSLRERLGTLAPARGNKAPRAPVGGRGAGQCPWGQAGMGYGPAWGGPPSGRGRGGPGWGRAAGYGRGRAFVDQNGDGICDNYQKLSGTAQ